MIGPTARQMFALLAIARHVREHGCAPTVRELGDELGISSTNAVSDHLEALERKGLVVRRSGFSRSLVLTLAGELLALRESSDAELLDEMQALQARRERVWAVVNERLNGGATCPTT